jgi:DNA-binding NarL/FixJ family response regulator
VNSAISDTQAPAEPGVRYRLLLVDDQVEARNCVRSIVSKEHDIVGEVSDGREVAESVRALRPDILLLDVSMPELSGFGVMRQLARENLEVKVLFITHHRQAAYVEEARRRGAVGYLLKSRMGKELVAALRQVASGGLYFSPALG